MSQYCRAKPTSALQRRPAKWSLTATLEVPHGIPQGVSTWVVAVIGDAARGSHASWGRLLERLPWIGSCAYTLADLLKITTSGDAGSPPRFIRCSYQEAPPDKLTHIPTGEDHESCCVPPIRRPRCRPRRAGRRPR